MKNFLRLLDRAKRYHKYFTVGIFGLIIYTIAQLISPKILQKLIKAVGDKPEDLVRISVRLALWLLAIYVINAFGLYLRSLYLHKAAWGYIADLRVELFDKLESLSMKFYSERQTGELVSRVVNDTAALETLVAHCIPDLFVNGIMFFGVLIILININVPLTLFSLVTTPLILLMVVRFSKTVRPLFKSAHSKTAALSAVVQDDFSGIKEIRAFNKQTDEKEKIKIYSYEHRDAIMSALNKSSVFHPVSELFNNLGVVVIAAAGGYMAYKNMLDVSQIVVFVLYINMLYRPINMLGRLNEDLQNSLAAADRIYEILDSDPDVKDKENAIDIPIGNGEIEFRNVYFAYNKDDVLKNISFTVKKGETVAIVGPTGVGKTTLVSLINRFYDPTGGDILIDGYNLKDITQSSLRENISMVLQDIFLFNGTVYDNIAYGVKNPSCTDVIDAAKTANADDFINKMGNGYETIIGERGVRLSGGQKQRIAIARAVLRNRPILILDEATAAVDTQTERYIQEAIERVSENKTTIIIAHRLSTVKNADMIYVLEEGKIVEKGKHSRLISNNGLYKKLCDMQFSE